MKTRYASALLAMLLWGACGSLPITGDGIVALELLVPTTLTLAPADSMVLRARALDINGNSVAATIRWYSVDTLTLSVDSISGTVRPKTTSGTGRVQAGVGTLRSDLISITVRLPAP